MDVQALIVMLIVAAAAIYFGLGMLRKARAFRPKGSCGDDCGCGEQKRDDRHRDSANAALDHLVSSCWP